MDDGHDLDDAIRRAQAGDAAAFDGIVRALAWPVRGWIVARCPPGGDADDVAQRTFISVFRRLAVFVPGSDFRAWVFTIARYELLAETTRLRRIADYHQRLAPAALVDELARRAAAEAPTSERDVEHLQRCLADLDPGLRTLLSERYELGLPLDEIARRAGRSLGAIKKHLFQLRGRLRACIETRAGAERA